MNNIAKFIEDLDGLLWGTPMTLLVLMTGIILSIRFGFRYQRKIADAGASMIGGCCRTKPDDIRKIAEIVNEEESR